LRSQYAADYIVVDAKNYTGKVNKSQVLQIANYLKTHGAGRFAMIFSRKGGDGGGCLVRLREQWAIHKKMILIFSDDDVERMLLANPMAERQKKSSVRKLKLFGCRSERHLNASPCAAVCKIGVGSVWIQQRFDCKGSSRR